MAVSGYREIPEDRILKFPSTPGFKGWKSFFTDESTAHPAKMNLNLLRWILETYTSEGDVVLDPMAGTGSTIILASILGRHGVAVEYEARFCDMIRANILLTERQATLTPKGRMTCIQGDARELSKLLGESGTIITSPPYAYESTASKRTVWREAQNFKTGHDAEAPYSEEDYRFRKDKDRGNIGKLALFRRIPCPPEEATFHDKRPERKGTKWEWQKEVKIEADAIVTSPPFGPSTKGGGIFREGYKAPGEEEVSDPGLPERHGRPLSDDPRNIDNLRYGESVDAVVTSPPYGNRLADEAVHDGDEARMSYRQAIDSIVTSPPYEDKRAFQDIGFMKSIVHEQNIKAKRGETKAHYRTDEAELRYLSKIEGVEYEEPENIGTLKGETYLGAMLAVYRECHKVLKPRGIMVIVIKNFIRNKQVVRLDLDTIRLCEATGFRLADRWYFKLPTRSFWRILYHKKYPDVPEVEFEDVLIFDKV